MVLGLEMREGSGSSVNWLEMRRGNGANGTNGGLEMREEEMLAGQTWARDEGRKWC